MKRWVVDLSLTHSIRRLFFHQRRGKRILLRQGKLFCWKSPYTWDKLIQCWKFIGCPPLSFQIGGALERLIGITRRIITPFCLIPNLLGLLTRCQFYGWGHSYNKCSLLSLCLYWFDLDSSWILSASTRLTQWTIDPVKDFRDLAKAEYKGYGLFCLSLTNPLYILLQKWRFWSKVRPSHFNYPGAWI